MNKDKLLEENIKIADLFDIYGDMLTDKQREIMSMYYDDDLSLGEIGENLSISRQGVYDIISRCKKTLENYEGKLGFKDYKDSVKMKFLSLSMEFDGLIISKENINRLKHIKNILNKFIEEI